MGSERNSFIRNLVQQAKRGHEERKKQIEILQTPDIKYCDEDTYPVIPRLGNWENKEDIER